MTTRYRVERADALRALDHMINTINNVIESCKKAKGLRPSERAMELSSYEEELAAIAAIKKLVNEKWPTEIIIEQ